MGREIKIFDVLFSCPSGVYEECFAVVNRAVEIFNREAVDLYSIAILLRHWSTDSYPQSGGAAQDLLDAQIVNNSDLAIAVFWTRFGTPTEKYGSGTEEEIKLLMGLGKQIFLYFLDKPIPPSMTDSSDYHENRKKILEFQKQYDGLYCVIRNEEELEKKIIDHLKQYFSNNRVSASPVLEKKHRWFRGDTGEEALPHNLIKTNNMITQLDGDVVRTETVLPNGKTVYAEIDIRENKVENIVADGFPQEYSIDISHDIIIGAQEDLVSIQNVMYRMEKKQLKFGGYLIAIYDLQKSRLQQVELKAPAGMKAHINPTKKTIGLIYKSD